MSHNRAQNTESAIIHRFIQNPENTMNSVLSNSVGMALLTLRNNHLDENPDERTIAEFCHEKIEELTSLAKSPEYADFKAAIEYILQKTQEPSSHLDTVTLYQFNGQQQVKQQYIFPLKEVLALVWAAIDDDSKYTQHYEGSSAHQFAQAKENYPHRLQSFLSCLQNIKNNPVCHHGNRNDLVLVLNKTYKDIHILEDADGAILLYLKSKLSEKFWAAYYASEKNLIVQKELMTALFTWMTDSNPKPLLEKADPDNLVLTGLDELFYQNGSNPKDSGVPEKIAAALTSLTFPADPKNHPTLAHIYILLNELEAVDQVNRNQALIKIQTWLREQYLMGDEDNHRVDDFYAAYIAHKNLLKHRDLLITSGQLSEEDQSQWLTMLDALFSRWRKTPDIISLTAEDEDNIQSLNNKLSKADSDSLADFIGNFFAHWFNGNKERLYILLLDENIQKKIVLTDAAIQRLQVSFTNAQHELELTPYWINRIFLHAILILPHQWSDHFAALFKQTQLFVAQNFNQDERETAQQLLSTSYPEALQNQLRYLQDKRGGLTDEQNPRPEDMLVLPRDARTAEEWYKIGCLLEKEKFKPIWDAHLTIIKKIIKSADDLLVLLAICPEARQINLLNALRGNITTIIQNSGQLTRHSSLRWLSPENQMALITLLGDHIKSIIQNGNQLARFLEHLSHENRIALITLLDDHIKSIIQNSDQLIQFVAHFSLENRIVFITLLGDRVRSIIQNGKQLVKCLGRLLPENQMELITLLGKDITRIIHDNDELAECLGCLFFENQMKLIALLGNHIKSIIQNGDQLAQCLEDLSLENKMALITLLGDHIKSIIQNGDQLAQCLERLLLPEKKMAFITLLGDHIKSIIQNSDQLAQCLELLLLPENQMALITFLGDHIKSIIQNGDQLARCLKRLLPPKNHEALITNLGDHITTIIENVNQLDRCWPYLPKITLIKLKDLLTPNQHVNQPQDDHSDNILNRPYYRYITEHVFNKIQDEFTRLVSLPDKNACMKAGHLLRQGFKLQKDFMEAINNNTHITQIHQQLVQDVQALAKKKFIHAQRNPVAAFFKKILGVLLAAPLLFFPLISKNYRGFFFDTQSAQAMRKITDDLAALNLGLNELPHRKERSSQ